MNENSVMILTVLMLLTCYGPCFSQSNRTVQTDQKDTGDNPGKTLRVAGAVIPVTMNIDSNVTSIKKAIDFAAKEHADILLTPEGSLSGYTSSFDQEKVQAACTEITAYARNAQVGLALGTCYNEQGADKPADQIRFYDKDGRLIGAHSKILLCTNMKNPSPGKEEADRYASSELKIFKINNINIGGLVCNDLWATPDWTSMPDPHLSQQLSVMGARIIFHAANTGSHPGEWGEVYRYYHDSNLQIRALTGKLWIVTLDAAHEGEGRCSHTSGVVDPSGKWVLRTENRGEQFFVFTIDNL